MLLDELWIDHLANVAHVEPQTSHSLWQALCTQLEIRLSAGQCVCWSSSIGCWQICTEREYVARVQGEGSYIIPPRLVLSISTDLTRFDQSSISLMDLEPAISQGTGIRPDAVRSWLSAIEPKFRANLEAGREIVWVGLGTFTPIIEGSLVGYTFAPSASFASVINRPFAMFAPVEIQNEAVSAHLSIKQGEALADFVATKSIEVRYDRDVAPLEPEVLDTTTSGASAMSLMPQSGGEEEMLPNAEQQCAAPNTKLAEVTESDMLDSQEAREEVGARVQAEQLREPKRRSVRLWWGVLSVLTILLTLAVWYHKWQKEPHRQGQSVTIAQAAQDMDVIAPDTTAKIAVVEEDVPQAPAADVLKGEDTISPSREVKAEPLAQTTAKTNSPSEPNRAEIVTIKPGHSLMQLALRKYGNKVFWVYIYEENREKLSNPDNIPLGVELSLPPARKYGIDPTNTNSLARALDLQRALLGGRSR